MPFRIEPAINGYVPQYPHTKLTYDGADILFYRIPADALERRMSVNVVKGETQSGLFELIADLLIDGLDSTQY